MLQANIIHTGQGCFLRTGTLMGFWKHLGSTKSDGIRLKITMKTRELTVTGFPKWGVMSPRPGTSPASRGLKTPLTSSSTTWSMVWLGDMVRSSWGVMGAQEALQTTFSSVLLGLLSSYSGEKNYSIHTRTYWEDLATIHLSERRRLTHDPVDSLLNMVQPPCPQCREAPPEHVSTPPFTVGRLLFLGLSSSSFLQTPRMEFIPKRCLLVSSDLLPCLLWIRGSMANFRQAWTGADLSRWAWLTLRDPCRY